MRYSLLFLFLITGILSQAQTEFVFKGIIRAADDSIALAGAEVYNEYDGKQFNADEDGSIRVLSSHNQLIAIRALGYRSQYFQVDGNMKDTLVEIWLNPVQYDVPEVNTQIYTDYEKFKYAVLNTEPEDTVSPIALNLPPVPPAPLGTDGAGGIIIRGGVTAIYKALSRYERHHKREMAKFIKSTNAEEKVMEAVVLTVGNHEHEKLWELFNYCDLDTDWVLRSDEYDLLKEVYYCMIEYRDNYSPELFK